MNINRHNYEEFFLLYIDNELNQEDRMKVDAFVQQNPDLAAELEMLQGATLPADAVIFDKKDLLFRKEEGISLSNYEEFFLLDVDKELNKEEHTQVEKFVLQHPELQNEFTLLHKSKLEAENIVFEDKEVLYKTEKPVRIIPVAWMRMSAAAAVFAIIAFGWILLRNDEVVTPGTQVAIVETPKTNNNSATTDNKVITQKIEPVATIKKEVNQAPIASLKENNSISNKAGKLPLQAVKQQQAVAVQKVIEKRIKDRENLIVPGSKVIEDEKESIPALAATKPGKIIIDEPVERPEAVLASNNKKHDQQPLVSQAAYKQVDTDEEDRNIYIGSAAINKNKIKALFKKASGLFKNNGDDEKGLQIAAFRLKGK